LKRGEKMTRTVLRTLKSPTSSFYKGFPGHWMWRFRIGFFWPRDAMRRTVASWWHSSLVSGVVCCSRKTTTKCLWQKASTLLGRQQNSMQWQIWSRSN